MTTHMHITAWVIGIILFFVTYSMLKGANPKAKMLHMITRLFYLLIFLTGGMLITDFGAYAVKMIVGIIVIGGDGNGAGPYEKEKVQVPCGYCSS